MQNNPMEFLKEAAIMHTIDHEHIVRLYGVVLDTNSLMLVSRKFVQDSVYYRSTQFWILYIGDRIGSFTITAGMFKRAGTQTKFSCAFALWFLHPDLWWNAVFRSQEIDTQVHTKTSHIPCSHLYLFIVFFVLGTSLQETFWFFLKTK